MQASKFEFEQRFWIFGMIFGVAFGLAFLDHTNFGVWLLHLLAPSIDPDGERGNFWLRIIFGCGAAMVFLAVLLRTWATAFLKTEVVHDMSQHSEGLVADGPYRYVRNPLYLANLPMMAGIGMMASRLGWFFIVIATWVFVYRLIFREEDGLLKNQGASYREYFEAVPRFWPALSPRVAAGKGVARWGQAIAGEFLFWTFGLAMLGFAITLNIKVAGIVMGVGFLFYFLVVPLMVKKRSQD